MATRKEIHDRVLNATCKEELATVYGEWAEQYDKDLIDEMGYVAPAIASQLLQGYAENQHIKILDAGCGTGLVGEDLHQNGYLNLEGFDYSVQMLEKAKDKGVYTRLHQQQRAENMQHQVGKQIAAGIHSEQLGVQHQ